ncbi:MAG: DUF4401 domain-containing protein [Verrucomicrobiales bacterium]|nr:DUF4401 domain-containing protein [Verrucomicrobiales bacterium]
MRDRPVHWRGVPDYPGRETNFRGGGKTGVMTLRDLHTLGLLKGPVEGADALLAADSKAESDAPWIARFALGFGAWLAGVFLTGAVVVGFEAIFNSETVLLLLGLIILAGGTALMHFKRGIFAQQLALAWNFAGYFCVMIGTHDLTRDDFLGGLIAAVILCPIIYWLSRNAVQRFLSVAWVWALLMFHCGDARQGVLLFVGILLLVAVVFGGLSGWKSGPFWRPTITSCLIGLFGFLWLISEEWQWVSDSYYSQFRLPAGIVVALGFSGLLWFLTRPSTSVGTTRLVLLGIVLLAVAWVGAPGIAAAVGLMAVAHERRDRWLEWLGILALIWFLIVFYYFLGVPLFEKSLWLMGIGVTLLIVRIFLSRDEPEPMLLADDKPEHDSP